MIALKVYSCVVHSFNMHSMAAAFKTHTLGYSLVGISTDIMKFVD